MRSQIVQEKIENESSGFPAIYSYSEPPLDGHNDYILLEKGDERAVNYTGSFTARDQMIHPDSKKQGYHE